MNTLYFRAIRATVVGTVAFFAVIFIPAWTLAYWQGWVFAGTLSVSSISVTLYIALVDEKLLERRLRAGPTAEKTPAQKIITAVGLVGFVAAVVFMVLDHRFHWSPPVPASLSILGDALGVLGLLIYFLVIRENRYAASTIDVADGQAWSRPAPTRSPGIPCTPAPSSCVSGHHSRSAHGGDSSLRRTSSPGSHGGF
jgi:hypothetical protein